MLEALPVDTDPCYPPCEDCLRLQGSLSSPRPTPLSSRLSFMIIATECELSWNEQFCVRAPQWGRELLSTSFAKIVLVALSPRPSIYYPRSPNTQTAVSQEDRTLVCPHRDCRVWVRREPVSGFFPYPCRRRGVVLCVCVGHLVRDDDENTPLLFLSPPMRVQIRVPAPSVPTTTKNDGSNLTARTKRPQRRHHSWCGQSRSIKGSGTSCVLRKPYSYRLPS